MWIQIEWMAASLEEARKVIGELLEHRLIGCANILPGVESHYPWEGKVETSEEVKVLLKSREDLFATVQTVIEANASCQVPAILKFKISECNKAYHDYLLDCV